MDTEADILRKALEREEDPKRIERYKPWAWQYHSVGATKNDIDRLKDEGYVQIYRHGGSLVLYLLTDKGRQKAFAYKMDRMVTAPSVSTVMESLEEVVGFDDIKVTLAQTLARRQRINFLLEGPPACAKSVILDGIQHAVQTSYMAFGSATTGPALSDILFERAPTVLLIDEVDKMKHDCYSILLGLMEKGIVIETKTGKTRQDKMDTMVIAACNSSEKLSPEFLSRFAFHPYFKAYTREEFIDVCIGMLTRTEGCSVEMAGKIGTAVYDRALGDVRTARGVYQLMMAQTDEELERVVRMNLKYAPDNSVIAKRKSKRAQRALPGL
jgi:Holliday junction DNA helicase RuvB